MSTRPLDHPNAGAVAPEGAARLRGSIDLEAEIREEWAQLPMMSLAMAQKPSKDTILVYPKWVVGRGRRSKEKITQRGPEPGPKLFSMPTTARLWLTKDTPMYGVFLVLCIVDTKVSKPAATPDKAFYHMDPAVVIRKAAVGRPAEAWVFFPYLDCEVVGTDSRPCSAPTLPRSIRELLQWVNIGGHMWVQQGGALYQQGDRFALSLTWAVDVCRRVHNGGTVLAEQLFTHRVKVLKPRVIKVGIAGNCSFSLSCRFSFVCFSFLFDLGRPFKIKVYMANYILPGRLFIYLYYIQES